ncbi:MAG: enoyl-CoA hydratase/isomerase family protein [bacterium]
MNNTDKVKFELHDSIGVITLSDPPSNQLASPEFIPADLFEQWMAPASLKGLIIRGDGKNFSAGGDLTAIFKASENPGVLSAMMEDGLNLLNRIRNIDIPVIAAINRVCFGGGLEIALACHIRVASENALLAFPEVNHNLMPGMGGTSTIREFTGFAQSAKMILGGDMLSASEAMKLGFIDFIAPKDQAFEYSMTLMEKMTGDRPVSVIKSIMKALKNASELPQDEAMREETRMFCQLARYEAERRKTEEA